ncbi:MAG: 16S rRNA (adenine(1518)-N(6)/adenine(1519)-N(6))-dimethyltransferase RsmA [Gammaproteobacteria bacterium]|nr:16S rRNA (adenine(1518)-N(6)/adenine(1519)-N(6))-dimethyltransferase RsmA [Gammaproteobacteria bacterium]
MSSGRPRKRFGQHFLSDGNIIRKIVAHVAPAAGDHFVEIGPGQGAITRPLLASGARLDAIEIDRDLARELPGRVGTERCTVHCADALAFDFSSLAAPGGKLRLVGNLPYNISTPLLFHFLHHGLLWRDLHVMLQKEVGERMAAAAGNRTYGRLTVALALRCRVEHLFAISPGSFNPPPQVDSVFLRLLPHPVPPPAAILSIADRLAAAAFGMRRKRLGNGLRSLVTDAEISAAGIDPGLRPEQLPPAGWLQLSSFVASVKPELAKHGSALPE